MTNGRWPVADAAGFTESVIGAGGRRLDEACQDGAEAYLGITVTGCPNFFLLTPERIAAARALGLAGA